MHQCKSKRHLIVLVFSVFHREISYVHEMYGCFKHVAADTVKKHYEKRYRGPGY